MKQMIKRLFTILLMVTLLLDFQSVSAAPTNPGNTVNGYADPWISFNIPKLTAPIDENTNENKFTYDEYTGKTVGDVSNEDIFSINREAATVLTTTGLIYDGTEAAFLGARDYAREKSPYYQLLTGEKEADWSLTVVKNEADAKSDAYKNFYKNDYKTFSESKAANTDHNYGIWKSNLQLPASWEHYGFDYSIYTNVSVPWQSEDSRATSSCPEAPKNFNPVGLYRKTFTVNDGLKSSGGRIYLNLQGVESSYYVYLNEKQVGYSEDSYSPHSFDVTDYLVEGENLLAIEVHRFCDGTWFELQDMYQDGGIFRDIYLYSAPLVHIDDWFVTTDLDENYDNAEMGLTVSVRNSSNTVATGYKVDVRLYDEKGNIFFNGMTLNVGEIPAATAKKGNARIVEANSVKTSGSATVYSPDLWSAELPNLYYLVLSLYSSDGVYMGSVSQQHGFREIEFTSTQVDENGYRTTADSEYKPITINGERLLFKGVNRHDTDPVYGKYISHEVLEEDVRIMKQNNINSLATAHYSNDDYLYYLCNKYGIMIEGEPNIEAHQLQSAGASAENLAAKCKELVHDRGITALQRLKNCTAIVMWEVQNECYWSTDPHFADSMYSELVWYFKNNDGTRPVSDSGCTLQSGTGHGADITSAGYNSLSWLENIMKHPIPSLQNEYDHSMGNSTGNLKDIWEYIRANNLMLGGFIWDLVDQGRARSLDKFTKEVVPFKESANSLNAELTLKSDNAIKDVTDPNAMSTKSITGNSYITFSAAENTINSTVLGSGKSFTMETFCYPTSNDGDQPIMGRGQGAIFLKVANNQYASQKLEMYVYNTSRGYAEYYTMRADLPDDWLNKWHHVVCTYDKGTMRLYVDDVLLATQTNPTDHVGNVNGADSWPYSFGAVLDEKFYFDGEISTGRLYNRALTIDEIKAQNSKTPAINKDSDNVVFWWDAADIVKEGESVTGAFDYYAQDYAQEGIYDNAGNYFAYGGDNGETYHDGNFCMNGLLNSDRAPQPEIMEVKYVYQNFWFTATKEQLEKGKVSIYNENNFQNMRDFDLSWQLMEDGVIIDGAQGVIDNLNIAPGDTVSVDIPYLEKLPSTLKVGAEYHLNLSVRTKNGTEMVPKNFEVAHEQFVLPENVEKLTYTPKSDGVKIDENSEDVIKITGNDFCFEISKNSGIIQNYYYKNELILSGGPTPNYWRAPMDNDKKYDAVLRNAVNGLTASNIEVGTDSVGVKSVTIEFSFPNMPNLKQTMKYHIEENGAVLVSTYINPKDCPISRFLRVGTNLVLPTGFENVTWYGNGPVETLWDRETYATKGIYSSTVNELFFPYSRTQDTGTMTETSWFTVTGEVSNHALAFAMREPLEFSALHFTNEQLTIANHPYELTPSNNTFLSINYRSQGTGQASCGPDVETRYTLPASQTYSFSYTMIPYSKGEDITNITRNYRKTNTTQTSDLESIEQAHMLPDKIDKMVVTKADQKTEIEEMLKTYNNLNEAGKRFIGEERYNKLLSDYEMVKKLAEPSSNWGVYVRDKSTNGFDINLTTHSTATLSCTDIGNVMNGSLALDVPAEKELLDKTISGDHPFTFEVALRPNIMSNCNLGTNPDIIISKGDFCTTLRFGKSECAFFICNTDGQWKDTSHSPLVSCTPGNNLVTVTATYSPDNGGTIVTYYEGQAVGKMTNVGAVKPNDLELWLGKDPDVEGRKGNSDFVSARVYSDALTSEEVKLSDTEKLKLDNLVAWYDFGDIYAVERHPATGVTLDKSELLVYLNNTAQLTATVSPQNVDNAEVTWKSDNTDVATVDENGKVTAICEGKAIITVATVDGSFTATCKVTVKCVDKTALKELIDNAENLKEADYTPETWEPFKKALDAAKKVAENDEATQEEVNNAEKQLKDAMAGLQKASQEGQITPPEIIKGAEQVVKQGAPAEFTSNAEYDDFIKVTVDNKVVSPKSYTVREGSTIVTLSGDFTKGLSLGKHSFAIESENGKAETTFTIVKDSAGASTDEEKPETGDNSNIALLLTIMMVCMGVVLVIVKRRKKANI